METTTRRNTGVGLLAAAAVLVLGIGIRTAGGEPAGALVPIAALFAVLGVGQWLAARRASEAAPDGD